MPYEDLTVDQKIQFHNAIQQKHGSCIGHLSWIAQALTDEEREARAKAIAGIMASDIRADSYLEKPVIIEAVSVKPTP